VLYIALINEFVYDVYGDKMKSSLTEAPISTLIKKIAIPASIGFLFNTLFNVVDTFFAGQISTEALSGLSVSFPIFFIIISIASGFGNGLTAVISNALGKKDMKLFHELIFNALILGVFFGLLFIFVLPYAVGPLFDIQGVSGIEKQFGMDYSVTIFYGAIFFIINFMFNAILSSQGNTKPFRNYLIIGFFLNIILDPLLIFGWLGLPALGTQGVALATIIVQAFGTCYMMYHVIRSESFSMELFKSSRLSFKKITSILFQSVPATLNLASIAIGAFIINYFVLLYGQETSVAAYGVALRIQQVALLPTIGLNFAVIALIGQNLGANKISRVFETNRYAMRYGVILAAITGLLIFILSEPLMSIFSSDPNVISIGSLYIKIDTIGFLSYVIMNILTSSLQGVKKPIYGLIIAFLRQLFPLLVFPLFAVTFGLGLEGVWYGIVFVNWIATFILLILYLRVFKKIKLNDIKRLESV
jgi:putative MATE family efflux protein